MLIILLSVGGPFEYSWVINKPKVTGIPQTQYNVVWLYYEVAHSLPACGLKGRKKIIVLIGEIKLSSTQKKLFFFADFW